MSLEDLDPNSTDIICKKQSVGSLVFAGFLIPALCVGLPASVGLLWGLAQRQRNGLVINIYILNVSIMDTIVNIFMLMMVLNHFFWRDNSLAIAGLFAFCITTTGRPLFAVCICFDCYVAAIFPVRYLQMKHSRFRLIACALVWSVTGAYGVTYVADYKLIYTPLLVTPFFLSLSTIVFFDVAVLHALRKPDPSGRPDVHPQKIKALQKITLNLVVNIVAYLPPVVAFGFSSLWIHIMGIHDMEFYCGVGISACIIPIVFSAIMPLFYLKKLGMIKSDLCDSVHRVVV